MGHQCPYGSQQMNWKYVKVLYTKFAKGFVTGIMKNWRQRTFRQITCKQCIKSIKKMVSSTIKTKIKVDKKELYKYACQNL